MMMLRIGQYSYFLIAIFTTISISCSNPDPADLRVKLSRYVSNSDSGVSKKQSNQLINYFLMLKPEKILTSDRMLIAAAFEKNNDFQGAMDQLALVPESDPLAANAFFSQAQIEFFQLRRAVKAENYLLKAIKLKSDFSLAISRLASIYDIQNRYSLRNNYLRKLDEISSLTKEELLLWTTNDRLDSITKEYLQILVKFVNSDSTDLFSHLALADYLRLQGKFSDAKNIIEKLSSEEMKSNRFLLLAELMFDQGELNEAIDYSNSINDGNILPELKNRYLLLCANINISEKKYSPAEKLLKQLLQNDPLNRSALQHMIQLLHLQNRRKESVILATRLQKIDQLEDLGQKARATLYQDSISWNESIVNTAAELGRFDLAKAWLKLRLSKEPLNQEIQNQLFQLDQKLKINN
jgi:DNA-binding SARP family transcriptional activator